MRECLDALVKNRTLKENVCKLINAPEKPEVKEKIVPTPEQMDDFFSKLKSRYYDYYLLTKFIASTGLRKGEAFALEWCDISLTDKTISISKSYNIVTKGTTSPKTRKSIRTIPLFDDALEAVNEIKRTTSPVFSFIGKSASNKRFPDHCKAVGYPGITFHTLRHVFTTRCLENGVDPKVIQKWLGHAKLDTTMNTYAHANADFEQSQLVKMAKLRARKVWNWHTIWHTYS